MSTQDFMTWDAYQPAPSLSALIAIDRDGDAFRNRMALLNLGGQVLGGQLAAHCLMAASAERPEADPASLHTLFVSACNPARPYTLSIEQLRSGRRMSQFSVRGTQEGCPVVESTVLLRGAMAALPGGPGSYCARRADVGAPEDAVPRSEIIGRHGGALGELDRALCLAHPYFEIREVAGSERFTEGAPNRQSAYWLRAPDAGDLSVSENFGLLALATDFWFTVPMFSQVTDRRTFTAQVTSTSLDHAIWFHARPRCDQWMLFAAEVMVVAEQSVVMRLSITDRSGAPIATVIQESFLQPIAR